MFSALSEKVERLEKENEDLKARLALIENTPKVKRRAHICRFEDGSKIYPTDRFPSFRAESNIEQLSKMVDLDKKGTVIIDIESFRDTVEFDFNTCNMPDHYYPYPVHFYYEGKYMSDVPKFVVSTYEEKSFGPSFPRYTHICDQPKKYGYRVTSDIDKLKLLLQAFAELDVNLTYRGLKIEV